MSSAEGGMPGWSILQVKAQAVACFADIPPGEAEGPAGSSAAGGKKLSSRALLVQPPSLRGRKKAYASPSAEDAAGEGKPKGTRLRSSQEDTGRQCVGEYGQAASAVLAHKKEKAAALRAPCLGFGMQ